MQAAQLIKYGEEDSIVVQQTAKPEPKDDELLVQIEAFGINPFDGKVRQGYMKELFELKLPSTIGSDLSGSVVAVGINVKKFKVGDKVFGAANSVGGNGSYAEFAPVKDTQLALKPESLGYVEAAAIPLAGASAYQAVYENIGLQKGQRILIHGGAGGIGSFAIQLAKNLGAYVATTVSADSLDLVKEWGADEAIDYKSVDFTTRVKEFDAVLDTVGGDTTIKSYQVLRPGGILVSLWSEPDPDLMKVGQVKAIYQFTQPTSDKLEALAKMVADHRLKVVVDKEYPFTETAAALEHVISGHPRGKVVVRLR